MSNVTLHPDVKRKPPARLLFNVDYDLCSPSIKCHADKAFARVFEFEEYGRLVRVMAYDRADALKAAEPELKRIRHEATLDLAEDAVVECWCGEKGKVTELFDYSGLDVTCGGLGVLYCHCGGDLCVCHHHGETDCPGCPDCDREEEFA